MGSIEQGSPSPWGSLPEPTHASDDAHRHWVGSAIRATVLASLAALAAIRGAWVLVAVAVASAIVLTVIAIASPRTARMLDAAAARAGRAGVVVVTTIGVGAIDVIVSLPGQIAGRIRRRSQLTGGPRRPSTTWRARSPRAIERPQHDRPWMRDVPGHRGSDGFRPLRAIRLVPVVALLLALDLVAGTVLGSGGHRPWTQPSERMVSPAEPAVPGVPSGPFSAASDAPAIVDNPVARRCLSEADALEYDYVQYLVRRIRDTDGTCISVHDGERTTYVPRGTDLPEIWLLGGSAAFGVGQRDDHTIASELARQSERDGQPVRVRNLAVPGFTAYQEALLLEQLLAVRPPPDLVIMYDGMNDVAAQIAAPSGEATVLPATVWRSDAPANQRSLWARWRDASFVAHALETFAGLPAGAEASEGSTPEPSTVADGVTRVLRRSVDLATRIAAMHGVPVMAVFQAAREADRGPVADLVIADLRAPIGDGSGVLGDEPAPGPFIDGVHIDEDGAVVVAADLRRRLDDLALGTPGP